MPSLSPARPVPPPLPGLLLLLFLFPLAAPGAERNELRTYVTSIHRLYESLEYERALAQVSSARRFARTVDDDVTLSLYEGIILADLRGLDESTAAFKSALLLRPDAKLPLLVSPKVSQHFERVRRDVRQELATAEAKREPERPPAPVTAPPVQAPTSGEDAPRSSLRSRALLPAIAGGVLVVAGGVSYGVARSELGKLRKAPEGFTSLDDARRSADRGKTWQTVGFCLAGAGVVGLGVAAGMYALGAPDEAALSLGVTTDGTSAFVTGRWP
jgi:hypothetical protein